MVCVVWRGGRVDLCVRCGPFRLGSCGRLGVIPLGVEEERMEEGEIVVARVDILVRGGMV